MVHADPQQWKVLLIGGGSGTGKTTVARCLAKRFAVGLTEVDDFRLVIERISTPQEQPAIHHLLQVAERLDRTPGSLSKALIEAAKTISYALEIVVANHVNTDTPIILEGDGITPAFAAKAKFAGLDTGENVRAVFLVEESELQLHRNALARKRGFDHLPVDIQHKRIHQDWQYGQWLQRQAENNGLPVLAPRPWETLEARIIACID